MPCPGRVGDALAMARIQLIWAGVSRIGDRSASIGVSLLSYSGVGVHVIWI